MARQRHARMTGGGAGSRFSSICAQFRPAGVSNCGEAGASLEACSALAAPGVPRVIPKTVMCGLLGEKLPLHGGGKAEKSYIHARDLSRAIHLVAEGAPMGAVYNAGPADPTSIRRVVELTASALSIPFEDICEVTEERFGQDSRYWLDSSAIKRDLGELTERLN